MNQRIRKDQCFENRDLFTKYRDMVVTRWKQKWDYIGSVTGLQVGSSLASKHITSAGLLGGDWGTCRSPPPIKRPPHKSITISNEWSCRKPACDAIILRGGFDTVCRTSIDHEISQFPEDNGRQKHASFSEAHRGDQDMEGLKSSFSKIRIWRP